MAPEAGDRGRSPADDDLVQLAWWSPDLLMMLDLDGIMLAVNPACVETLGWQPGDLMGERFLDFIHTEDRRRAARQWARVVDGGTLVNERNRWPTDDGAWRWLSWSLAHDSRSRRVFAAGRDVTHEMDHILRVTEDRELLSTAERLADVGSWEWSIGPDIVALSEHMRRLMGIADRGPISSGDLLDLTHPDDRHRMRGIFRSVVDVRAEIQAEFRIVRPDGVERTVVVHAEPAMNDDGAVSRLYGAVQDVTDQRHADRLKDAFLAAVSHELRTPLTIVQGVAATLTRLRGADEPRRWQLEDALLRNVDRLSQLMSDLLDLGRLQREGVPLRPSAVDIPSLVARLVAATGIADRVEVEGPSELSARADAVMVERIVFNLLENAAKYAPSGPVRVRYERYQDAGVRLAVEDEGPGLPDADLERVFRPFYRVADEHPQPGTGVGLALVSEFAQAHRGRAWAEADGAGARFVVELPPTPAGSEDEAPSP